MNIAPELGLPARYTTWRDDQYKAVEALVASDKPMFLLDAPTGIGKSLLAIGSHRIIRQQLTGNKCIYITRTKQLQDQIMHDFGDIAVSLKGKANYPCLMEYDKYPEVTADDCKYESAKRCRFYNDCPYYEAKLKASRADLVVLNDAYFLNEANGMNGVFASTDFLVVDEVDSIEAGLMNFIQFTITGKQLDKYGLKLPEAPGTKEGWIAWMPAAVKDIIAWTDNIREQLGKVSPERWEMNEIEMNRSAKKYEKLAMKLAFLQEEINYNWIFYSREVKGEREWVFKPVDIGRYADWYLWKHGARRLGMSGTIFSPDIACRDLGIEDCDYMRLECPFPLENRPIYYKPIVNLTRATMQAELPILTREVDNIIAKYPAEKVLIHTVSYAVRDYLKEHLSCQERLICHESNTRESSLIEFKASDEPLVMLSPSFDRGVDLPGEDNCRAVIVCKMPYLDMSDPQIKRKLEAPGGGTWYALKTTQTLVQMCGRSVRSATQKCDCVTPDMKILTADLNWKDAAYIEKGDKLLAFDEERTHVNEISNRPGWNKFIFRKWRWSEVLAVKNQIAECFSLELLDGRKLYCTGDHRWLIRKGSGHIGWERTDNLKRAHGKFKYDPLIRYLPIWDSYGSYKSGWLAGFADGEGCIVLNSGHRHPAVPSISLTQKDGIVLEQAKQFLNDFGFEFLEVNQKHGRCKYLNLKGGFPERLRFLGKIRPIRLLEKYCNSPAGQALQGIEDVIIVNVESIGRQEIVAIETSTGTFFCEGFGAHNCYILDRQFTRLRSQMKDVLPAWWLRAVKDMPAPSESLSKTGMLI